MIQSLINSLSILTIYFGIALSMLLFFEVGYQFSSRARYEKESVSNVGSMVGGILGMLGFVLALTFFIAATQHNERRQFVLDEANAIGTAYLRADLLKEQFQAPVKSLLRDYVKVRLQAINSDDIDKLIKRSTEIHKLLWYQVVSAAKSNEGINTSLMIHAANSIIDIHEGRLIAGLYNRIPDSIWLTLFTITALTMITMGGSGWI